MLVIKGGVVLLALVGAACALTKAAGKTPRRWAVTGSLLLGRSDGERGVDLRFATVLAAVATLLSAAGVFSRELRALSTGQVAFAVGLTLPLLAALLAMLADFGGRYVESSALEPEQAPEHEEEHPLVGLLDQARFEVRMVKSQVEDPGRVAALDALSEAVSEYEQAMLEPDADRWSSGLDTRIRGVITLARSCLDEEGLDAAQRLGVRPDASPAEVTGVYRTLCKVYTGPDALPGVSPDKHAELTAAYERLKARAAVAVRAAA